MNTGQSLLSLGALFLLSLTVLRVNNNILSTESVMQDSKFGVLATSLATSIIEKASNKAFDANTDGNPVSSLTQLTSVTGLGPASNEHPPDDCDDFDDFNGYHTTISNLPSAIYDVSCEVCYVNPTNPNGKSSIPTWHKKMTVKVTSKNMGNDEQRDTIKLSTIYSYWYFR